MIVNKTDGFTLVELIVVIIILSILAVSLSIRFTNSPNLYAQARWLANDIRYAQSLSMALGQRYRFRKQSNISYTICDQGNSSITMPNGQTSVILDSGSNIQFGTLSNFTNYIEFDIMGTPYADQSSNPTNQILTIQLTQGGLNTSVTVTPETGWVSP